MACAAIGSALAAEGAGATVAAGATEIGAGAIAAGAGESLVATTAAGTALGEGVAASSALGSLAGKVGTSVLTSGVGSLASSLFGRRIPGVPAAPIIAPVTPMPLPDDQSVIAARRRSIAAQLQNQGRASTILSQGNSDKLGN